MGGGRSRLHRPARRDRGDADAERWSSSRACGRTSSTASSSPPLALSPTRSAAAPTACRWSCSASAPSRPVRPHRRQLGRLLPAPRRNTSCEGRRRIAAVGARARQRHGPGAAAWLPPGPQGGPACLRPRPRHRASRTSSRADGAHRDAELLALPEPPDAVFCFNDLMAIGALRALRRGRRAGAGGGRHRRLRRHRRVCLTAPT